jgi:hypothetical protein
VLGSKEAETQIIGCDLHARQQTLAMLDTATGEAVNRTLPHEGESVREFYSTLPGPVRVGIEATGSMKWFVNLMEELGISFSRRRLASKCAVSFRQLAVSRFYVLVSIRTEKGNPAITVLGSNSHPD